MLGLVPALECPISSMEIETLGDAFTHSVQVWMACAWGPYTKGYQRGRECQYRCDLDLENAALHPRPGLPDCQARLSPALPALRLKGGSRGVELSEQRRRRTGEGGAMSWRYTNSIARAASDRPSRK